MAELHEQLSENARMAAQADAALKGAADLRLAADEHARLLEKQRSAGAGAGGGVGAGKKGNNGKGHDGEVQTLKKTIQKLQAELESTRQHFDGLVSGQGKSDRSMLGMIEQGRQEQEELIRRKQSVVEIPVLIPGGADMVAGFEKILGLVEAMEDSPANAPEKVDDADAALSQEAAAERKMRGRLEEAAKILGRVWMMSKQGKGDAYASSGGGGGDSGGSAVGGGSAGGAGEEVRAGAGGGVGAEGMLRLALKFRDAVVKGWFKGKTDGSVGDGGAKMLQRELEGGRVIPMDMGGRMLDVLLQW